ncbi:MAG: hypothetical protein A2W47_02090 [Gammaproteobacteria bacterium RIFCSPHIGHO2_12_38_15]|nr:MAG: hypothetical protein A2W47_02090 [Gammaproteobacteria bacterium RIFCSPHIGHO2_12_38_15]
MRGFYHLWLHGEDFMFRRLHQFFDPVRLTLMSGITSTQLANTRSLVTYAVRPTRTDDPKQPTSRTHFEITLQSSDKPLSEQEQEERLQAFCAELRKMRLRAATIKIPVDGPKSKMTAVVVEAGSLSFEELVRLTAERIEERFNQPHAEEKNISLQR